MDGRRIVRFALVGGLGSLVYAALVFIMAVALKAPLFVATSLAFIATATFNYLLHYTWTYESDKRHTVAFAQFLTVSVIGFGINNGVVYAGKVVLGLNFIIVQIAALGLVVISNYLLNSYWTFATRAAPQT